MTATSKLVGPLGPEDVIDVAAPFRRVNALQLELLDGFTADDWQRPTVHSQRDVKDLTAHLLHGSLRRLSADRDRFAPPTPPITSYQELVGFIQADNRAWMTGAARLSPRVLIELMRIADPAALAYLESLDPHADACFPVAWAGDTRSPVWFDVAREYTEKWHHQQQLRDATGRPPLYDAELLTPTLETFARGLPHAFRAVDVPVGAAVSIVTTGPVRLAWTMRRAGTGWTLWRGADPASTTQVSMDADHVWRMWTRGLDRDDAEHGVNVHGPVELAEPLIDFVAIMA